MLLSKKSNTDIHGVEILKRSYDLAIKNVKENNLNIQMFNDDVENFSVGKHQEYDIIVSNPPYFDFEKNENQMKQNIEKQIARNEKSLTIEKVISLSSFMLKNNGHLYLVFRADKLFKVFKFLEKYNLTPKVLKFVYTKNDSSAKIVLLDCAKNVKDNLIVEKSIYVYDENNEKSKYINDLYS
ncbi:tRNA1(Val) (adenine(37)-N6)-methyltransferase [Caviibacter abscessus]|uniref:tRNA1(Val) (adenine(37)-N6)-methyltransferase n=1 Tax=Caviibacter abscessus TaxID=1766719 RepID=UPI00082987B7|nr:methyltransferase [Caviibacter abscessus]